MTIPHQTSTCGIICTFWTRQKGQHNIISSRLNAITAEQLGPSKCRSAMLICNNNNKSQARARRTSHQHSADLQTSASKHQHKRNAKHEPPSATRYIVLAALRKKRRAHDLPAVLPDVQFSNHMHSWTFQISSSPSTYVTRIRHRHGTSSTHVDKTDRTATMPSFNSLVRNREFELPR